MDLYTYTYRKECKLKQKKLRLKLNFTKPVSIRTKNKDNLWLLTKILKRFSINRKMLSVEIDLFEIGDKI